jgi:CubicO group peptidase (beta-lactamase class C family)
MKLRYCFSNRLYFQINFGQTFLNQSLDKFLSRQHSRAFNGEVLVSQNGKTFYKKVIGIARTSNYEKLKFNCKVVLLSNTKQINALLVLRKVDKGKLDLQKNLRTYLPDFPQKWADSVNIHQLLNHTSGIVSLEKPLSTKPGTTFKYTDLNYILLGKIVEAVTNNSFEKAVNKLFRNCGMKNSSYLHVAIQSTLVSGFHISEHKLEVSKYIIPKDRIPAGGLVLPFLIWKFGTKVSTMGNS